MVNCCHQQKGTSCERLHMSSRSISGATCRTVYFSPMRPEMSFCRQKRTAATANDKLWRALAWTRRLRIKNEFGPLTRG